MRLVAAWSAAFMPLQQRSLFGVLSRVGLQSLNLNSEVERAREQHLTAGARRSRRFTPRLVLGVGESQP